MILDHTPIPIEKFMGLYGIDSYRDSVPLPYSIDEFNVITFGDELKTRDGFGVGHSTSSVEKFAIYRKHGETSRRLVLRSNSIIDLTTSTTILTITGMTGFTVNYANGRAYISPTNGVSGLPGSFVYVYNGTGTARKAAGLAPVAGFTASISATAGVIESGTHIFAWTFETDSGFVTPPSAAQILIFDGTKAVSFTNIPTGPSGTAKRRLVASRAIQDYNGNELGYEMFFVPGGEIANNSSTTLSDVDFFDADLQESADFTYDQLEEIPAVVFIRPYGSRLCYGGPDSDKSAVYVSNPNEPESIHSSAGILSVDPHETEGVKDAVEFRDNLYVMKRNKTVTYRDNSYEPSTWRLVDGDSSIGCDINGIAVFYDTTGTKIEWFIVNSPSGIYKFNGIYEELALSRNIKSVIWDNLAKSVLYKSRILIDQDKLLIYVLISLGGVSDPNYILVGNYENGFQLDRIKWHLWGFEDFAPSDIGLDRDANGKSVLKVSSLSGNIYVQEVDRRDDNSTAIENYVEFAQVGDSTQSIKHCGGVGLRIKGSGTLNLDLYGLDGASTQELADLTLSTTPGKDLLREAFFNSERISLRIGLNAVGSYFKLNRVNIYTNVFTESRPNV